MRAPLVADSTGATSPLPYNRVMVFASAYLRSHESGELSRRVETRLDARAPKKHALCG
jgi:hypothetical protein